MRAKRAEKGQNLIIFWGALVFPRDFAIPQRAKPKIFLKSRGKKGSISGASVAAFLGGSWELVGASLGLPWGFRPHSPPTYENSPLPALWCNRSLGLLVKIRFKGILRGFIWVYRV